MGSNLYTALRKEYLTEWRTWYRMHQLVTTDAFWEKCYVDVIIDDEWHGPAGFIKWFDHMGPRPKDKECFERIDKFGDFAPGNVRWSTFQTLNTNKRWDVNHPERSAYRDLAKENGIDHIVFNSRLHNGWNIADAATLPLAKRKRYKDRIL
tara:strand:- start:161 stop:613 length:453 start_codon:yes stop_codon:yes gene_type:complete